MTPGTPETPRQVQAPEQPGLAAGAVRGTAWNITSFALSKGVLLVTTVVLARLLEPADFGLLALGLLAILYLDVLGDVGVGAAVIYRKETAPKDASTAVLLAACTGLALAATTVVLAPYVAALFDEPRLTDVLRVLAGGYLFGQFGAVQKRKLEKELDFRRVFVADVAGAAVKGCLSIGLALAGTGVWSLVWGHVAGLAVTTVLLWLLATWRFEWSFDSKVARELLSFGLPITLLGAMAAAVQTLDSLVIGKRLGAEALGFYTIAYRLPQLLVLQVCYIASNVLFPAYTKARDDPARLRSGFQSTLRLVSVTTVPVALGLAVVAPDLLPLVFGERWTASVVTMQFLAVYGLVYSLAFNVGDVYKATGRPGVLNRIVAVRLALTAPALWLVAPGGIVRVAMALLLVELAMTVLQLTVASRLMSVPLGSVLAQYVPALTAGAVMLVLTLGIGEVLPATVSAAGRIAVVVVVGAAAYLGGIALVSRSTVRELQRLVGGALRRPVGA